MEEGRQHSRDQDYPTIQLATARRLSQVGRHSLNPHDPLFLLTFGLIDRYNRLAGSIKQLANRISLLDSRDPFRAKQEKALLDKLYAMGIITSTSKFSDCNKVTVSAFCRRRLPIVMCRLKMAETVKEATTFIEQGHVRVGPTTINDPAYLVTRTMEDFVTWVDTSKIKRKIMKYNDKVIYTMKMGGLGEKKRQLT